MIHIRIEEVKEITDKVSKTFCLAKWHHTTIYLQSGETHSCYHPAPHKIPLSELTTNPSALHNTREKKLQRLEMLNGDKPAGCQYCWNIEDMGDDYVSDRLERNASIFNPARLAEITNLGHNFNVNPEYIEVSFGNECNFKCGYCHPKASSSYYKEIKTHGRYPVVNHGFGVDDLVIYEEETNPYVKAWWEWWPQVSKTLNILRITGGEPLLQASTWRLLEDLQNNPLPNLELNINTNFGVKPKLIARLVEKVNDLVEHKKIKDFKIFTSVDTWGNQAEYIRTGLDLSVWERNLDTFLSETTLPVTFMVTFNILSVSNFTTLLTKILEWRVKYNGDTQRKWQRIRFDTPYLKEPLQYDMNILPKDQFMPLMAGHLQFIKDNIGEGDRCKFTELEYEKFRRVVDYMATTEYSPTRVLEGRKDFYAWFNEHDRRRNTDFLKTFPDMKDFYMLCKDLYE